MNLKTWIATGALAVVVVGGSITGATVHNASVQAAAQAQHVLVVKAAAAEDQVAADAAAAQAVIDAAAAQKVIDDAAAAKAAADAVAAQQAAAAVAAQAAAQQAAAAAAAQSAARQVAAPSAKAPTQRTATAPATPALIKCPAGSTADAGNAGNDTSCFPDICFRIMLPDAAHPECVTPFKP